MDDLVPSGRVDGATASAGVLLLTDIIDSLHLVQSLGDDRWAALWQEHDRAARALLQRHGGTEVEKTDGFLLLFDTAADAARFALGYHEALARLSVPLLSRVGIHAGPYRLRRNDDGDRAHGAQRLELDGLAKPVVARVMSLALGGQTLLSEPARTALAASAGDLHLRSQGHWRLKGLAEPLELFELAPRAGAFRPPPDSTKAYRVTWHEGLWRPQRELRHNLPAERDVFVGRAAVLQDLAQRYDAGARLVSLLGMGGAGKTRLALRYGHGWLGDFEGGVWFCDLSPARGADGVVAAVAQGLQLPPDKGDAAAAIGAAIAARARCLVILDNFEQVWTHAESTLGRWLEAATEACFLVTTREALSIAGEQVMPLPPLPPAEAAQLFCQRAAALGGPPGLEQDAAVPPLVALLDGLPLALELAAARTPVLAPAELLARMNDRFRLLAAGGGRRDRQATLRATLDGSWELLTEAERAALAQLSVFDGSFTLAAAEAVLDIADCADAPWAVDAVQSLVRKSFVRSAPGRRFELLSSVQEYAAEHLATPARYPGSGPAAALAVQRRHWRHFAAIGARAAVADRCAELGNLSLACRRAAAHGDAAATVDALGLAWFALLRSGPFHAGLDLADAAAAVPLSAAQQAVRGWVVGSARRALGQFDAAAEALDEGLQQALAADDAAIEAHLRSQRGELFNGHGDTEAAASELRRALALARGLQDPTLLCSVLNASGNLAGAQGALDVARAHYAEALTLAEAMQDARWAGGLHGNLGALAHEQGRFDDAQRHYQAALVHTEQAGERRWAANTRCNLGLLFHDLGRPADAEREFTLALATAREMANGRLESTARCNLGLAAQAQGRGDEALSHFDAAVAIALRLGQARAESQFRTCRGRLLVRRGATEAAQQDLDRAAKLLAPIGDAPSLALVDCVRAEWALASQQVDEARAALARAETQLPAPSATAPSSELARECARVRGLLEAAGQSL